MSEAAAPPRSRDCVLLRRFRTSRRSSRVSWTSRATRVSARRRGVKRTAHFAPPPRRTSPPPPPRGDAPRRDASSRRAPAAATTEDAAAADRVAQASARFLSEYVLAAGGGGAVSAVGDDEPAAGTGLSRAAPRRPTRRIAAPSPLSRAELIALWDDVAAAQFPAMTAHASPLVRAAGLGCLVGLVATASKGVSRENRRALIDAPHAPRATNPSPRFARRRVARSARSPRYHRWRTIQRRVTWRRNRSNRP